MEISIVSVLHLLPTSLLGGRRRRRGNFFVSTAPILIHPRPHIDMVELVIIIVVDDGLSLPELMGCYGVMGVAVVVCRK